MTTVNRMINVWLYLPYIGVVILLIIQIRKNDRNKNKLNWQWQWRLECGENHYHY